MFTDGRGICGVCGSHNLEYTNTDIHDDGAIWNWTCKDCDSQGSESYIWTYQDHDSNGTESYRMTFVSNKVNYTGRT